VCFVEGRLGLLAGNLLIHLDTFSTTTTTAAAAEYGATHASCRSDTCKESRRRGNKQYRCTKCSTTAALVSEAKVNAIAQQQFQQQQRIEQIILSPDAKLIDGHKVTPTERATAKNLQDERKEYLFEQQQFQQQQVKNDPHFVAHPSTRCRTLHGRNRPMDPEVPYNCCCGFRGGCYARFCEERRAYYNLNAQERRAFDKQQKQQQEKQRRIEIIVCHRDRQEIDGKEVTTDERIEAGELRAQREQERAANSALMIVAKYHVNNVLSHADDELTTEGSAATLAIFRHHHQLSMELFGSQINLPTPTSYLETEDVLNSGNGVQVTFPSQNKEKEFGGFRGLWEPMATLTAAQKNAYDHAKSAGVDHVAHCRTGPFFQGRRMEIMEACHNIEDVHGVWTYDMDAGEQGLFIADVVALNQTASVLIHSVLRQPTAHVESAKSSLMRMVEESIETLAPTIDQPIDQQPNGGFSSPPTSLPTPSSAPAPPAPLPPPPQPGAQPAPTVADVGEGMQGNNETSSDDRYQASRQWLHDRHCLNPQNDHKTGVAVHTLHADIAFRTMSRGNNTSPDDYLELVMELMGQAGHDANRDEDQERVPA